MGEAWAVKGRKRKYSFCAEYVFKKQALVSSLSLMFEAVCSIISILWKFPLLR